MTRQLSDAYQDLSPVEKADLINCFSNLELKPSLLSLEARARHNHREI